MMLFFLIYKLYTMTPKIIMSELINWFRFIFSLSNNKENKATKIKVKGKNMTAILRGIYLKAYKFKSETQTKRIYPEIT